jgi:hypothetical protein
VTIDVTPQTLRYLRAIFEASRDRGTNAVTVTLTLYELQGIIDVMAELKVKAERIERIERERDEALRMVLEQDDRHAELVRAGRAVVARYTAEESGEIDWLDAALDAHSPPPAPEPAPFGHLSRANPDDEAAMTEVPEVPEACRVPPAGWHCTRGAGHEGPCAAVKLVISATPKPPPPGPPAPPEPKNWKPVA